MLSIIIPVYNEEKILNLNLPKLLKLSEGNELIFVDAQSTDGSFKLCASCGKAIKSQRGRALQMNSGAALAQNDILLFLHADNIISPEAALSIEKNVRKRPIVGGCLSQRIDKKGVIYRIIEAHGNFRAWVFRVFYGDQGIFARKDVFLKIGGFPDVPIMEDVFFSRRLRDFGKAVVLSDKIFVSARRWESRGIAKTILLYGWISLLFKFGYPLNNLKRLYDDLR